MNYKLLLLILVSIAKLSSAMMPQPANNIRARPGLAIEAITTETGQRWLTLTARRVPNRINQAGFMDSYTFVFNQNVNSSDITCSQRTFMQQNGGGTNTKRNPPCAPKLMEAVSPFFSKPDKTYWIPFSPHRGNMWNPHVQQAIEYDIVRHLSHAYPSPETKTPPLKFYAAQFIVEHNIAIPRCKNSIEPRP